MLHSLKKHNLLKPLVLLLLTLLTALISSAAFASSQQPDYSSFQTVSNAFQHFFTHLNTGLKAVINEQQGIVTLEFRFFAVVLLIFTLTKWAMGAVEFNELYFVIIMIALVHVLMLQYDELTKAVWGWSEGVALTIQLAVLKQTDAFYAVRYIWNLVTNFSLEGVNLLLHPWQFFGSLIILLQAVILCILGFFASVWGLYGYSLAKMVGLIFVPTILFERLSFLFDGWLRFFFGFLIFNILARANLMLVVIAESAFFNIPHNTISTKHIIPLVITSVLDGVGIIVFLSLAIIGLFSTGAFVSSIVAGSNTGPSVAGSIKGLRQMVSLFK